MKKIINLKINESWIIIKKNTQFDRLNQLHHNFPEFKLVSSYDEIINKLLDNYEQKNKVDNIKTEYYYQCKKCKKMLSGVTSNIDLIVHSKDKHKINHNYEKIEKYFKVVTKEIKYCIECENILDNKNNPFDNNYCCESCLMEIK